MKDSSNTAPDDATQAKQRAERVGPKEPRAGSIERGEMDQNRSVPVAACSRRGDGHVVLQSALTAATASAQSARRRATHDSQYGGRSWRKPQSR